MLVQLQGKGQWEDTYRVLNPDDIRAVNEQTVTDEELRVRKKARKVVYGHNDEEQEMPITTSTLNLQLGKGHHTVSWIWVNMSMQEVQADLDGSLHEGIRLEWVRARACAERWQEEVILLEEEMWRALAYCTWRAQWWAARLSL